MVVPIEPIELVASRRCFCLVFMDHIGNATAVRCGNDGPHRMTNDHVSIEDESYIGFVISDVARLLRTVFDRRVREVGLTRAQWLVLTRLHRRPGASQSELAEMLEVEKATAGRMIDRLEANGWVVRKADPSDRRINRLYLTEEAERTHKAIRPIAEATVNDALAGLSDRQRATLTDLMGRVKSELQTIVVNDMLSQPVVVSLPETEEAEVL
jgi:MarR family transcriptional regulator for hemolysin